MADYLIATEQRAHDVAGGSPYTSNMCCTKARATTLGASLYSPSSGYSNNELVRYENLYLAQQAVVVNVAYSGITITSNWRIHGAPQYVYSGTIYSIVASADWPVGANQNTVNLPTGVSSVTITQSMWVDNGLVIDGSNVTNSNTPTYITFKSSSGGSVVYQKQAAYTGSVSYVYYTNHGNFVLTNGITITIYNGNVT